MPRRSSPASAPQGSRIRCSRPTSVRCSDTLAHYGLDGRFRKACGGDDIHAGSKEERARRHLADLDVRPEDVIYFGDTAHDAEAAAAMGVDCVLAAHGHQHRARLEGLGTRIIDGFGELLAEL